MFRQDRTNPSTAISNWRGRHDSAKGWPSTAVSTWLNGGLFAGGGGAWAPPVNGFVIGGTSEDRIDVMPFATETVSLTGTALSSDRYDMAKPAPCSTSAAYVMGGRSTGGSLIQKMLFADYSVSTLVATLSGPWYAPAGCQSMTKGYKLGGADGTSYAKTTSIDACTFDTDAVATLGATLPTATLYNCGLTNRDTAGYSCGGEQGHTATIYKLTYSTEAVSTLGDTLSQTTYDPSSCTDDTTAGYVLGGYGTAQDLIQKMPFATETISSGSGMVEANYGRSSMSGVTAGYAAGGAGSPFKTYIDKLTFASDTASALSAVVFPSKYSIGASGQ